MLCKKPRYKTKKIFLPQPKHTIIQKEIEENDNKENIFKNKINNNELSKMRMNTSKNSFSGKNSIKVK